MRTAPGRPISRIREPFAGRRIQSGIRNEFLDPPAPSGRGQRLRLFKKGANHVDAAQQ